MGTVELRRPHGRSILPYVWMLLGSVAFAVMATAAHALRSRCDWQVVAFGRTLLPLTFSAILAWSAGVRFVFFRPATLWLRSIAGSISVACTFFALSRRLPVSDVLTLTNMFPIWVAVLSWPMLRQRPSLRIWVAVGCGVLGVGLIQQPNFGDANLAVAVALLSSISTAFAMIGLHRLQGIDFRAIVVHFSAVALIVCTACLFLFDQPQHLDQLGNLDVLAMLVMIGTAATVGQLFLTKAFTIGVPAKVSLVGLTQIVFALLFDELLWPQPFDPIKMLGILLVVAPTAWVMAYRF